ncbi:unnamed protein product [Ceratitis capitata]|uniref:(Mediterranean fruit fly) hypothetical protein n=1 Tax=Ceratitis capitata TaxID=7213 RepID=A0A811TZB4_CERCA|nr:unnamed protein product [Ceratitis capitata]
MIPIFTFPYQSLVQPLPTRTGATMNVTSRQQPRHTPFHFLDWLLLCAHDSDGDGDDELMLTTPPDPLLLPFKPWERFPTLRLIPLRMLTKRKKNSSTAQKI